MLQKSYRLVRKCITVQVEQSQVVMEKVTLLYSCKANWGADKSVWELLAVVPLGAVMLLQHHHKGETVW